MERFFTQLYIELLDHTPTGHGTPGHWDAAAPTSMPARSARDSSVGGVAFRRVLDAYEVHGSWYDELVPYQAGTDIQRDDHDAACTLETGKRTRLVNDSFTRGSS